MGKHVVDITLKGYRSRVKRAIARRAYVRQVMSSGALANNSAEATLELLPSDQHTLTHNAEEPVAEILPDCSSDDESDDEQSEVNLRNSLRVWANDFRITQTATTALLKILRENGFSSLPSDVRTLVQTPKHRDLVSVPPGQYCHIGLKKALEFYKRHYANAANVLTVDFNIDGVPISNSSQSHFWLILAGIFA